jgi:hypothetical protein
MDGYTLAWGVWLAAFALVEGKAIANKAPGDTFSEHTRKLFATHTKPGRFAFAVVWLAFTGWYLGHILKWF